MSTTAPVTPKVSKVDSILHVINLALKGITLAAPLVAGPIGAEITGAAALVTVLQGILAHALQVYHQETGQPIDLAKIPFETVDTQVPAPAQE